MNNTELTEAEWAEALAALPGRLAATVVRVERVTGTTPLARVAAATGRPWADLTDDERRAALAAIDTADRTVTEWKVEVTIDGQAPTTDGLLDCAAWEAVNTGPHKTRKVAQAVADTAVSATVAALAENRYYDMTADDLPLR